MDSQVNLPSATMDHTEAALVSLPGAETTNTNTEATNANTDVEAKDEGQTPDSSGAAEANSSSNSKKPMKRMTLNDAQKYEVCLYMKEEEDQSNRLTNKTLVGYILERFGIKVDESTVSRLRQQSESRLSRSPSNPGRRRNRDVAFPELERSLEEYVLAMKRKVAITDPMIISKGKELRVQLNIPEDQMKFSDGWLNKFKVRHGLKSQTISKTPRATNGVSKRRTRHNRLPLDRPDQEGTMVTALPGQGAPMDLVIESSLPSSLHTAGSNLSHDDHHLDVDMDLGAGIDVDHSEGSQSLHMDQVLRQQLSSHPADFSNRGTAEPLVSSNPPVDHPVVSMDLLSNVYGNALGPTTTAPPEHSRQQTPQLMTPKGTRASHKAAARSTGSRESPLESVFTDSLAGLALATPTAVVAAAAAASQMVSGAGATSVDGDGTGIPNSRPVTAARASLNMRLADPIAAAFQPDPPVGFTEASECLDTLRLFMQQQHFSNEQLAHLKAIYLTLDIKRKQQEPPRPQTS